MSKTTTSYSDFIHRGPKTRVGNNTYQPRVGAVVAVLDGQTLNIGWSLCNSKDQVQKVSTKKGLFQIVALKGDRFNPELAMSLAEGRARLQHTNSLKYSANQKPSAQELMRKGIPQSSLSVMANLVKRALADHPQINRVVIFNSKTPKAEPVPQPLW